MASTISILVPGVLPLPLPRGETGAAQTATQTAAAPLPVPGVIVPVSLPAPLTQAVLRLLPPVPPATPRADATTHLSLPLIATASLLAETVLAPRDEASERVSPAGWIFPPLPPAETTDAQRACSALSSGLLTPALLRQAYGLDAGIAATSNPDAALIQIVRQTAALIGYRLAIAVEFKQISRKDLFGIGEAPDTPLALLAQSFLPAILSELPFRDHRIMLAMATTRTSFVPTPRIVLHLPYQTSDARIAAASAGYRRLYDPAARDRAPFTLRPCNLALTPEVTVSGLQLSAPILVDGHHWGCLRLAYRRD